MSDWIEYDGSGNCPEPHGTEVMARLRSDTLTVPTLVEHLDWRWSTYAPGDDVLRYKVVSRRLVDMVEPDQPEYTGGSVSYYRVEVTNPTSGGDTYTAECNDIIEALGMNYAEGNAFKAIWRRCAARTLGKAKAGYKDGLYDAEKVVFFGERMVAQEKLNGDHP